jgi:1-deoxy-D-xylulose-5-phosphate reductoisomerase
MHKNISILGSTGSVGKNTLEVVKSCNFTVQALAANSNVDLLEAQAHVFKPKLLALYDEKAALELKKRVPNIKVVSGIEGLKEAASLNEVDLVVAAMSGSVGLIPTIAAINAKKDIAIANKEVLVCAGNLIVDLAKKNKVKLLPVDSEHSAIFQCLERNKKYVKRIVITASGGPFLNFSEEKLRSVSAKEALKHPTYSMGEKISIDSSTLMNKGLEVIEAHFLFSVALEKIEVVIHPQSLVHSFVEFVDGSMLAQVSEPNMKIPIQYALSYPKRIKSDISPFDFVKNGSWQFSPPDLKKFRCLYLAYEALKVGKSMPCYMNGVNEVLVKRFLNNEISWIDISLKLEKLMSSHKLENVLDLDTILEVDKMAKMDALKN